MPSRTGTSTTEPTTSWIAGRSYDHQRCVATDNGCEIGGTTRTVHTPHALVSCRSMTLPDEPVTDEGVLDPWVVEWMAANPGMATPMDDFSPEVLELARGPVGFPPTLELATITDDDVDGVPIRIYQGDGAPTGLVVYFHGGGYVLGSIGLMDNVAPRRSRTVPARSSCRSGTGSHRKTRIRRGSTTASG